MAKEYEQITAPLWRDGYHAAARLIEQLATSLQPEAEMEWMKQFTMDNSFDVEVCRYQLRAAWTAYCLHNGYQPDTFQYDCNLEELWKAVAETEPETADWSDLDSFDQFMCELLV